MKGAGVCNPLHPVSGDKANGEPFPGPKRGYNVSQSHREAIMVAIFGQKRYEEIYESALEQGYWLLICWVLCMLGDGSPLGKSRSTPQLSVPSLI
jgi:hypothetical protein